LSSQISARYGEGLDEQVSAIRVSRYYRKAEYRRDQEGLNLTALAPALQQSIAFVPRFENVTADEPRRRRLESTGPILGCVFDHFLPQYLTRKYDVDRAHAEHILDSLLPARDHEAWLRASALRQGRLGVPIDIPSAVQRMLVDAIRSQVDRVDPPELKTLADWRAFLRGLGPIDRRRVNTAIGAVKADIERELLSGLSPRFSLAAVTVPSPIHEAVKYIDHFFGNRVKYLGPLREEPRPLYALSGSTDVLDVGIKGEYTAAVIDTNRDVAVTHIPPSDIQDGKFGAKAVSEPLLTALAAWLRYMGVSESVETSDLGNVGHKLRVTTHGLSVPVELTHVGVGVSQVLPIVVSCLLAAPGTTLVFEQPELHLHPRVQTLLADLFLSTALTGKQCVVETHSEYLINRLRLRIAMSQERRIEDDVQIYFVQKESHQSEFVPVEVNEFGSITDWPSGFFDQSQTEAERILRAGMAKRSQGRLR
jgi:predicted ATPase